MYSTVSKITNRNQAMQAVSGRKIVIASIDAEGSFSLSANPVAHNTLSEAVAERTRLATMNPGKVYVAMQLTGASVVSGVQHF